MLSKNDKKWIQDVMNEQTKIITKNMKSELNESFKYLHQIYKENINQIKIELIEIVNEELKKLVMNEVIFEELVKDERTGKPVKTGKQTRKQVNLLQFMTDYVSKIEGAWRGYQADIDRIKAQMNRNNNTVEGLIDFQGKFIEQLKLAGESARDRELVEGIPQAKIEISGD